MGLLRVFGITVLDYMSVSNAYGVHLALRLALWQRHEGRANAKPSVVLLWHMFPGRLL